jgi:uncharacterized membrane protein
MSIEYLIILLSFFGLFAAYYINSHKSKNKKLVCPLKADCESVIHSEYSYFLGFRVEHLGIFYYLLILISYSIYIFIDIVNPIFEFVLFSLSFLAFLFSIYLTLIQVLKIRKFCSWCLMSALCSFLIFFGSYFIYKGNLILLAGMFKNLSIFVHALSSGVGLGVVLVTDYLFMKFLKDKKISNHEKEVLDHLSDFIWLVLGLIIVSGFYIYMSDMAKYHISTKFQFKMIVIGVIVLNGFLMNLIISPKLLDLDMVNISSYREKMAIMMGGISITSWFLAFLLGRLKSVDFSLMNLVIVYFLFLLVSSFVSVKFFQFKNLKINNSKLTVDN